MTTHEKITYQVSFTTHAELTSTPNNFSVGLGTAYPTVAAVTAKDPKRALLGWYDQDNVKVYDGNGKPLLSSYVRLSGDQVLTARVVNSDEVPTNVYIDDLQVGGGTLDGPGWYFDEEGVVHLLGRTAEEGDYEIRGTNLLGQISFLVESNAPGRSVTMNLNGLALKNDRAGLYGLFDLKAGASVTLVVRKASSLETLSRNAAAIHCPFGASITIKGTRTADERLVMPQNEWTVKTEPFYLKCDTAGKGETVDLALVSGESAAAIGGYYGQPCGDITLDNCDLSCTPNGGATAARVHEIGDGQLDFSSSRIRGGHITFLNIPALRCPIRTDHRLIDSLTLVRPRPHDEYGVPLMPMWLGVDDDWVIFCRPGILRTSDSKTTPVPRSATFAESKEYVR